MYAHRRAFTIPAGAAARRMSHALIFVPAAVGLASLVVMAAVAWREAHTESIAPMLCLAAAACVFICWQLDRLSQQGGGYRRLLGLDSGPQPPGPLCQLMAGETLAALVDRPFVGLFRHLGPRLWSTAALALVTALLAVAWPMQTAEGPAFTWLYRLGSGVLLLALLGSLGHTTALWKETRRLLHRLAHSPLSGSFLQIDQRNLDWRPRPSPTRRDELAVLMAAADELDPSGPGYRKWLEQDATGVHIPLLDSPVFFGVWQHLEQYLPGLARAADDPPQRAWAHRAGATLALLLAFTIRDLLRRIVFGFAAVNVGLALVFAAHLFYSFHGRTSVLVVDSAAIALGSLLAARALWQMQRDAILSRLWKTPGRWTLYRAGL